MCKLAALYCDARELSLASAHFVVEAFSARFVQTTKWKSKSLWAEIVFLFACGMYTHVCIGRDDEGRERKRSNVLYNRDINMGVPFAHGMFDPPSSDFSSFRRPRKLLSFCRGSPYWPDDGTSSTCAK